MRLTPDMISIINQMEEELAKIEDYKTSMHAYETKVVNTEKKIDRLKRAYAELESGKIPVTRLTR